MIRFSLFALTPILCVSERVSFPGGNYPISKKALQKPKYTDHNHRSSGHRELQGNLTLPDGIWTSRGYGWTFQQEITETSFVGFDETAISCILNPTLPEVFVSADFVNDETALLMANGGIGDYTFDFIDEFQSGCKDGITSSIFSDPDNYAQESLQVWNIFVQSFEEQYAFFELRDIEWRSLTDAAGQDIKNDTSNEDLTNAMISVLAPLDDYHVSLYTDEIQYDSKPIPIGVQIFEEFQNQTEIDDIDDYSDAQITAWIIAVSGHLDAFLEGDVGEIAWGTASDGKIGYFQIFSMGPDDRESYFEIFEEGLEAMKNTSHTIIVDIRVNGGGTDEVSLKLASYFTQESFLGFSKRARDGDNVTDTNEVFIQPSDSDLYYGGKIILIVSGSSGSATEIFTLSMKQLPQVTLFGRNTAGGLSDVLVKSLPNGWQFTISNEIYLSPDGELYEMVGIPPDVYARTELLIKEERDNGVDSWLDEALELAQLNAPPAESDTPSSAPSLRTAQPSPSPTGSLTPSPTENDTSGARQNVVMGMVASVATIALVIL